MPFGMRPSFASGHTTSNCRCAADGGPDKDAKWDAKNWNAAWHLPVLLDGVAYPSPVYNVPHIWQFTQSGRLSVNPIAWPGKTWKSRGLNYA
jgi:hypothetical protein